MARLPAMRALGANSCDQGLKSSTESVFLLPSVSQLIAPAQGHSRGTGVLLESCRVRSELGWISSLSQAQFVGSFNLRGTLPKCGFLLRSSLLVADDKQMLGDDGIRRQPFIFFLRSAPGCPSSLLPCTSPVGIPHHEINCAEIVLLQSVIEAKLCMVPAKEAGNYTLSAEGDILFSPKATQIEEVLDLLESVVVAADRAERELLGEDAPLAQFREAL